MLRARLGSIHVWFVLLGAFAPRAAQAQSSCNGGHGVELAIELEPPNATVRERLGRQLKAELGARSIDVCSGVQLLARVLVRAKLPELNPALVQIRTETGVVERSLDVSSLPRDARPSAIASGTHEFLAAVLEAPPAAPAAPVVPTAPDRPAPPLAKLAPARSTIGNLALGLSGAAARFRDAAQAFGADLHVRISPLARVSVTASVGASTGSQALPGNDPVAFPATSLSSLADFPVARAVSLPTRALTREWHVELAAGFELLPLEPQLGLAACAGLRLSRSTLRLAYARGNTAARLGLDDPASAIGFDVDDALRDTDHTSDLVGSAGLEGRWHTGRWGFSTELLALVPLRSSHSQDLELSYGFHTPRSGLGARLGAELSLGVWYAFDDR